MLDPKGSLMVDAPFVYQAHVTIAWLLFAVWPFTRLVHVWSVPVGYVVRSPSESASTASPPRVRP